MSGLPTKGRCETAKDSVIWLHGADGEPPSWWSLAGLVLRFLLEMFPIFFFLNDAFLLIYGASWSLMILKLASNSCLV